MLPLRSCHFHHEWVKPALFHVCLNWALLHAYFLPELTLHFRGLQSAPVSFMLFLDSNITCVCWAFSHYFYNIVLQNLVFEVAVSSFCIEDEGMVATLLHKTRFKQAVKRESTRKLSNFNFQWTKPLYQNNLKNIAFFFTFFKWERCT